MPTNYSTMPATVRLLLLGWLALGAGGLPPAAAAQAPPASSGPVAPTPAASLPQQLDGYVQEQVQKGFQGVVLVARAGHIVFDQAYGNTQRDMAFWTGSLAKQFTAAAILKLVEQGKLRLSDPITRFWPEAPANKRAITIEQLLTHTSGLGHYYTADGLISREQAVRRLLAKKLATQPGTYLYSNDGYSLLAIVVELASGQSYEQYVQTQLLQPAGLQQTGFWGAGPAATPLAPWVRTSGGANQAPKRKKHVFEAGQTVANYGFRGATGFYSTAADLYRWVGALRTQRVLTDSSQRQLFAPRIMVRTDPAQQLVHYGLGWVVVTQNGRTTEIRHAGDEDWLGHNAMLRLVGDDVIIVLSNAGAYQGRDWSNWVAEGLRRKLLP